MNVTIKKDANGEYRVPSPDGREAGAYYTDDKSDAYDTALLMWKSVGAHTKLNIKFRTISTYHNGD